MSAEAWTLCPTCRCPMRDRAVHPAQRPDGTWATFAMDPHCVPCWLASWSHSDVRTNWENYSTGNCPSDREHDRWSDALRTRGIASVHDECNATEPTTATSLHRPPGVIGRRQHYWPKGARDSTRLGIWLEQNASYNPPRDDD